jgi:carbon monoxide dehydrogenase subunit G
VDAEGTVDLPFPADTVFAELRHLDGYPDWLSIVDRVEAAGPGPVWMVDLGARLGPLRRTKRVRMVRVDEDPPTDLRFERVETDGREHSAWVLSAGIQPEGPSACRLTMHLHYGGRDWLPLLGVVLREEIRRAGQRLQHRLAGCA